MKSEENNHLMKLDLNNVDVIFPNGEHKIYPKPFILSDLLNHPSLNSQEIIALKVNGLIKSLNAVISVGRAKISTILKDSELGWSIYQRTLVQILATAVYKLFMELIMDFYLKN